jgi:enamine deaminase RidA (YjgF/YER057c/UK114 family)
MQTITQKVASLGLILPVPPVPAATYVPFVRAGDLLFVSGQIATVNGEPTVRGPLGGVAIAGQGHAAARDTALCVIAQIAAAVDDDLTRARRIVKLTVFIAAVPEFQDHSQVANGASDLFVAVFGDAGKHARSAVGVASLPRGAAVEIEAIVELDRAP